MPRRRRAAAGSVSIAVSAADVTRRYGSGEAAVDALRGVTIDIPRGQFAAIMGPSGSGKSTLMHVLAGLDQPTSGTVHIAGEDITKMNDAQLTKLRRAHIGFVFQAFNLLPTLTAEENILLPLQLAGRKVDRAWYDAVVERVGLADRTTPPPVGAVRRPAAARRRRARARVRADRAVRRRADGQPRLAVQPRGARAPARRRSRRSARRP